MTTMEVFGDKYRLSFRSNAVVDGYFSDQVKLADRAEIVFGKRKTRPKRTHIVNALILWLQAQPEAERLRIMSEGMGQLNALAQSDPPSEPMRITEGKIVDLKTPKRRKKQG